MNEQKQVDNFKEHLRSDNQTVKPIGDFVTKQIGFVEVEYGLTDVGDYAIHFSSFHKAKPFPTDPVLFLRIIKTFMESVIPSDIHVDVYLSPKAWEKQVISIIARGFGKKWNFNEQFLEKPILNVCERMTHEINIRNPRRTNL